MGSCSGRFPKKEAAKEDNAEAMNALGEIYRDGKGVKLDLEKSINYFMKAAKKDGSYEK
jgi:TPR repeat protein